MRALLLWSRLLFATAALAGCAGTASLPAQIRSNQLTVAAQALYVVNFDSSTVTVYEPNSRRAKRTLTAPKMLGPNAVAFDSAGNAYVASSGGGPSSFPSAVYVYQPGAIEPYKAITNAVDIPERLAFDSSGNLYVANFGFANPSSVAVFSPGSDAPSRIIYDGIYDPVSLAFDSHGDLFVTNHAGFKRDRGSVMVYAPGATEPKLVVEKGVNRPTQAILDQRDNLYVANDDGGVSVYKSGRSWPSRFLESATQRGRHCAGCPGQSLRTQRLCCRIPAGQDQAVQDRQQ